MEPAEHDDWLLMQKVGEGDEAAMAELYDRFVGLVYKTSRQMMPSRAEAEDAVQETFIRLWQTADRFDPNRAKLVTWVMLISRRHLIDRLRRKSARPEQLGLDSSVDFLGPVVMPPRDVGGNHDLEILQRRVAELPELQRVVIERTYIQGFTLREVSEQLNAPLGTVKSALSRGLARLRDRLMSDNKIMDKILRLRGADRSWPANGSTVTQGDLMQFNDGNNYSDRMTPEAGRGPDLRALAVLDALGLLDDVDAAQFDRAFRDSPAALQAELRVIQAAAVADPAFLATEEPSPELKLQTLTRVMTAVEQQESQFAPIALIGRMASRGGRRVARSVDTKDLVEQAMELAALRKDVERFTISSYYWRAASIALTAALTVALVFQLNNSSFALKVSEYALGNAASKQVFEAMEHPGGALRFEKATFLRSLVSKDGAAASGTLTLAVNINNGAVMAIAIGVQKGTYTVRHRSMLNVITPIGKFEAVHGIWGAEFTLALDTARQLNSGTIELVDSDGSVVMSS